jgi:ribonuclease HI
VMLNNNTAAELIFALLRELSCVQAWILWKIRNMRLWQNVTETSQAILERARQLLFSWRDANRKQKNSRLAVQQHDSTAAAPAGLISVVQQLTDGENVVQHVQVRWQKPEHGRLKCNVDASFSEALNCVGFGFCIRDEAGNFVQAQTMWSNPVCSTDVGEGLGLSHAIRWVHALQLTNVDFELDAKKVVDYFNNGSNDITEFGVIVEECRRSCNLHFENSKVEFTRRQANEVAHTLAREATFLASPHTFNVAPLCIATLIINEKL